MKFSNIYLLYPANSALERAIANAIDLLGEDVAEAATPDSKITVADNFLYTRGYYEQHRYSSNIFASLREDLEILLKGAAITDTFVSKRSQDQEPFTWIEVKTSLGNILAALGQQHKDAGLFEKAIQHFNDALAALDQEQSPLEWAATQYNLGTACQALGRLLDDAKPLKNAVDAYTNALLVWSREKSAKDWMYTMHQLGMTFHAYGKHLKGNRTFQKAVVAYKNALAVLDADNYPYELTATHNNCGAVLHHLAESERNPDRLEEAIRSYEKAWTVAMEQQLPIHIAVLCKVNKTTARNALAELLNDTGLADEVADEFEVIIECFPHALQPLCLKHCEEQKNKAKSLTVAIRASG